MRTLYHLRAFQAARALSRLLPRSAVQKIAQTVGFAAYNRCPNVRATLCENLAPVTGISGNALDRLANRNIRHFSTMLGDYFYSASRGPGEALKMINAWRGYEHVEAAKARGKGIIIVTAHLGHWELGGILLAERGLQISVITLDEPSSALTDWRDSYRRRAGMKTIAVGPGREFAFVEMIQTLRRNECLAMLVDRPYGDTGVPVRLCGRQTQFSTGPALLHQHTGATVVPAFLARGSGGEYVSFAEPIVEMRRTSDKRSDLLENTQAIASAFEPVIQEYPDQWFHYVPIWNSPDEPPSPPAREIPHS